MLKNRQYITRLLFYFFIENLGSCGRKVYPDEKLAIAPEFLAVFNSMIRQDTVRFHSETGGNTVFIHTPVDSIIQNIKTGFLDVEPYKLLFVKFREIGKDTTTLISENEIFVNKEPGNGINSLGIQFNNLFFLKDTTLPQLHKDTLVLNGKSFTNYYAFENSIGKGKPKDVRFLYINIKQGFLGYETVAGEEWVNEAP